MAQAAPLEAAVVRGDEVALAAVLAAMLLLGTVASAKGQKAVAEVVLVVVLELLKHHQRKPGDAVG